MIGRSGGQGHPAGLEEPHRPLRLTSLQTQEAEQHAHITFPLEQRKLARALRRLAQQRLGLGELALLPAQQAQIAPQGDLLRDQSREQSERAARLGEALFGLLETVEQAMSVAFQNARPGFGEQMMEHQVVISDRQGDVFQWVHSRLSAEEDFRPARTRATKTTLSARYSSSCLAT